MHVAFDHDEPDVDSLGFGKVDVAPFPVSVARDPDVSEGDGPVVFLRQLGDPSVVVTAEVVETDDLVVDPDLFGAVQRGIVASTSAGGKNAWPRRARRVSVRVISVMVRLLPTLSAGRRGCGGSS